MLLAGKAQSLTRNSASWPPPRQSNATETVFDYARNDLLIGSPDPFFWFLLPFFGIISVGLCIAINYAALAITHIFTFIYTKVRTTVPKSDDGR
jgi:glycosylphosphatidylinositol deacylase